MRLGVVIPLKSKRVSFDWDAVCMCLEGTLESLLNQTSGQWIAIVVGHEKPDIDWNRFAERVRWSQSQHPLPPIKAGGSFRIHSDFDYILDKNRKTGIGMRELKDQGVTYWFVLDADDLVHRDFVSTLEGLPVQAGWVVDEGYLLYRDLWRFMPVRKLSNLCGSTAVISASCFNVPESGEDARLSDIPWCRLSHSDMGAFLSTSLNGSDSNFPFRAIAYTLSHGDNCSDEFRTSLKAKVKQWIKKRVFTRAVSREFVKNFGIRSGGC